MKTLLILCLAVAGLVGFAPLRAQAAVPTAAAVAAMPPVVHVDQTVVLETGHRHYYHHRRHYYHHRRYYYRHHRRYYYN